MILNPIQAYTIMFFTGGFLYCGLEIIYRGFSHISMLFAGGICFLLVGFAENLLGESASLLAQMLFCSILITAVEFAFGLIVNRQLHWNVWDYSGEPYNYKGQICLFHSNLWFLLSGPMIFLYDFLRHLFLGMPLPHYKL
jgi:uncharacterized membrane protein